MAAPNRTAQSRDGGFSDFIWNLVGGAMVAMMLSGVIYVFVGMLGTHVLNDGKFWELNYLKWYFISVFAIYLLMPALLANVVGFIFGSKSRASGSKPQG